MLQFRLQLCSITILSSIVLFDLMHVLSGSDYLAIKLFSVFLYIFAFFVLCLDGAIRFNIFYIIFMFISIKLYIFCLSVADKDISVFYLNYVSSDAAHYHIPKIFNLAEVGLKEYLLNVSEINGKLTHSLNYLLLITFEFLYGENLRDPRVFSLISYVMNTLINIFTILLLYKSLFSMDYEKYEASSATLFFALNPFFIYYSLIVQKETLLFLGVVSTINYLIKKNKISLFLSIIIFFFDRPYMLLFTIIMLAARYSFFKKILILIFFTLLIEIIFGIHNAFLIKQAYVSGMKAHSASAVPISGLAADILTIFFGPLFFRPLLGGNLSGNIFYTSYYFMLPVIYILSIYCLLFLRNKLLFLGAAALLVTFLIYPQHSTLKLTMLIPALTTILPRFRRYLSSPLRIKYG